MFETTIFMQLICYMLDYDHDVLDDVGEYKHHNMALVVKHKRSRHNTGDKCALVIFQQVFLVVVYLIETSPTLFLLIIN